MSLEDLISLYGIDNSTAVTSTTSTTSNNEISKDAFLQLLITQLQYQDPLDPVKNEDMIAQLATFSSLEQLTAHSEKLDQIIYLDSYMIATTYVGKEAFWADENGEIQSGIVDYMEFSYDEPLLYVGEQGLFLSQILAVQDPTQTMTLDELQKFIGFEVSWTDLNGDEQQGIVEAAAISYDGTPVLVVDGEEVSFSDITRIAKAE